MVMQPKYISGSLSITYHPWREVRRKATEIEDILNGEYSAPTVLPVPDNFEPEVPRLIFESSHGYSQLVMSQVTLGLNIKGYSPDFQQDQNKRVEHFLNKLQLMFVILQELKIERLCFTGMKSLVRIERDNEEDASILNHLSRHLLNYDAQANLFDIEVKRTETIETRYYHNVTVSNYRAWANDSEGTAVVPRTGHNAVGRGIQIVMDFNDRYAFNEQEGYGTNLDAAKDVIVSGSGHGQRAVAKLVEEDV